MSGKQNLITRGQQDLTSRQSPKKYSHYFMPRPQTINHSKVNHSEKGSSLDVINHKRSSRHFDNTEIIFKREKPPTETKRSSIKNSQNQQQKKLPLMTPHISKNELSTDNLKMSIAKYQNLFDSNNDVMKNIVKEQILSELTRNDPIFKKINKDLVESLMLIGKIKIYEDEELVAKTESMIGFILYGRIKIFNKDYRAIIQKGETIGQHHLFNFSITFKVRCLQPTCIFWLPVKYYTILRQESIKNGLKNEFNHLQIALRLSYIKKKFKETLKKSYL